MLARLFWGFRHYRYSELPPDYAGDISKRHTLVTDAVIPRSRGARLDCESEQMRGIKPVHCCPAVASVTDVRGDAFFARYIDKPRDEAVIAVAVYGRRKSHR